MQRSALAIPRPKLLAALPWTERNGKLSLLKLTVFLGLCAPGLWLVFGFSQDLLGTKPLTHVLHETGLWTIRFLFLSLLITPARRIFHYSKLINLRRMLGLAALAYGLAHLGLYVADQAFDLGKVASEIVLRVYLTIGFLALLAMGALGLTSTDAMIKRMGPNWNRLHKLTYAIAILGGLHFFMQAKSDVSEAVLMAGFFVLLMSYRQALKWKFDLTSPLVLAAIALIGGLGAAALEFAWYALATGIPPLRVLEANLDFTYSVRPAWWVAATGLGLAAVPLLRKLDRRAVFARLRARPAA